MKLKIILISFVFILLPSLIFGQVDPDCGPTSPNYPDCLDPARAPITEGIIFLIISAVGLGIKTFSKKNKK